MSKVKFIFDVDNTLTPSKQPIDRDFSKFLTKFFLTHDVFIASGSWYSDIREQLGLQLCVNAAKVYACSGNEEYVSDVAHRLNTSIRFPKEVFEWCILKLETSKFVLRIGNHIDKKYGSLNFSTIGRTATIRERKMYREFDEQVRERESLVLDFNNTFSDYYACIGGETGIDIFCREYDKSQIMRDFCADDSIIFFADSTHELGNDYTLAKKISALPLGKVHTVSDWKDTYKILKEEYL